MRERLLRVGLSHQALLDTLAAEDVLAWATATKDRVIEDFEANLVEVLQTWRIYGGFTPNVAYFRGKLSLIGSMVGHIESWMILFM